MKLTDAQLVVLNAAAQRPDRLIYPLPASLKNAMINARIVAGLISRGLAEGQHKAATITDAGLAALGITADETSPAETPEPIADEPPAPTAEEADMAKTKKNAASKPRPIKGAVPRARSDSKQARMINMMQRPEGASLDELVKKFDWQPHTVRGAVAGALKKKLGLKVEAEKDEKRGLVYRIAA